MIAICTIMDLFPILLMACHRPTLQRINVLRRLVPYVYKLGPAWFRRMVMHYFPLGQVRDAKEIVDTMQRCSSEIFASKKIALARGDEAVMKQVGEGKDIMSILSMSDACAPGLTRLICGTVKANSMASEADRIPEEELVAQMSSVFFVLSTSSWHKLTVSTQNVPFRGY